MNTQLVKVLHSQDAQVRAQKYCHQNILKVPKVKVLIMKIGPFQNNILYVLIINTDAYLINQNLQNN